MPRGRPPKSNVSSVEGAFRELIRSEIANQLEPLQDAVRALQNQSEGLNSLQALAQQLSPLTALFGGAAPVRRGPGRPPKALAARSAASPTTGRRRGRPAVVNARACAIQGCRRPARSKGYCAAHYQKLRMLTKSNRRPAAWTEFAEPNSVPDVVLPRGRAAHKAK